MMKRTPTILNYYCFLLLVLNASAATLATCPRQCICQEHSIACSCDGAETSELIISSLGSTYITSLTVHTCDKVTVLNGSFAGVVLIERLSFIAIPKLHFESHAFKDIIQSPKQFVIDECEIPNIVPLAFVGLSHIDHFWIRNSKIGEISTEAFHQLTNVDYIYFHKTKIEIVRKRGFSKMYQISHMYLRESIEIEDIDSHAFSDSQVDEIILDGANIINAKSTFLSNIFSRDVKIQNCSMLLNEDSSLSGHNHIEQCRIIDSKMNMIDLGGFGCLSMEFENSKIARISQVSRNQTLHISKIAFSNTTIDLLDTTAFSNFSLNDLSFDKTRITRIGSFAFQKSKIHKITFDNSVIGAIETTAFKKSNIHELDFLSMDISEIETEAFESSQISRINFENCKIDRIWHNVFKNMRIGHFRCDGSRIHKLDDLAFYGENRIKTLTLTASDISTPTASPEFLQFSKIHPTHLTIANNTIDCLATKCVTNAFLLNSPKHHPLLWQVANNKCRPPVSSPCVEPRYVTFQEYGISCRFSHLVAECACISSDAILDFEVPDMRDPSLLIIGDCEKLEIVGATSRNLNQLYIFRTARILLKSLPENLKVLKIFHSTVMMLGNFTNYLELLEISHSKIAEIVENSLGVRDFLISGGTRVPRLPKFTFTQRIEHLNIHGAFIESSQQLFALTNTLRLENSMIFESSGNLGTVSSAEFLNNTILACCPSSTRSEHDPRCSTHFYGVKCEESNGYGSLSLPASSSSHVICQNSLFFSNLSSFRILSRCLFLFVRFSFSVSFRKMLSARGPKIGAFTQRVRLFSTQVQAAASPVIFVGKGSTPRQNSLLGPNDVQYPFQGDVAFGGNIDRIAALEKAQPETTPKEVFENILMSNRHSLKDLLDASHIEPDARHLEQLGAENMNQLELNAADVEVEMNVMACPKLLKKEMKFLFPQLHTESMDIVVMNLCQKSEHDMKAWSEPMEEEREKLTAAFIMSGNAICTTLRRCGYWADFIDPSSGRPYMEEYTNHTLFETHDAYKQMGFKIEDLGCCKVIMHSAWGSKAFVGTIFTNAPSDSDIVQDILKKVNHEEEQEQ